MTRSISLAFFAEVNRSFHPRHVVAGELLGFTVLLLISLLGFALGLAIPRQAIGLLGLLPILIGLAGLIEALAKAEVEPMETAGTSRPAGASRGFESRRPTLLNVLRDRRTYAVSLVTVSNGSNNLSIYIPLFASLSLAKIGVLIPVLYGFVILWLLLSFQLTRFPGIAVVLNRYTRRLFLFILIWLGVRILHDTGALGLLLTKPG